MEGCYFFLVLYAVDGDIVEIFKFLNLIQRHWEYKILENSLQSCNANTITLTPYFFS